MSGAAPTSRRARRAPALPLVQFIARPGIIDLGWGHPDPTLLPVEALADASDRASRAWGADLLAYGSPHGPGPLVEALAAHVGRIDGREAEPASIVVTAGASQALDLVATLLASPGDVALVEAPTYHIALKLLRDRGLEPIALSRGPDGIEPAELERTLADLTAAGRRVAMLYTIPTFHNPTGGVMSLAGRQALADVAARHRLLVVEDDPYRELWFDAPPPPALWTLAPAGTVIRLGSFSKTLAPGLRLGYLVASPAVATRLTEGGLLDSGGGIGHYPGLIVAELMRSGAYAAHVDRLRVAYRARRDALVGTLRPLLDSASRLPDPTGGYFAWLTLDPSSSARALLPRAEDSGVSYMPGDVFAPSGGEGSSLRLSFSRYGPEDLAEAARRLGRALADAESAR